MIGLKVHDRNGVLTFDDKQRGHSWTRNFWNAIFTFAGHGNTGTPWTSTSVLGAGYISWKRVNDYWYDSVSAGNFGVCYGTIASSDYGIVVGTSDTAFSVEQTKLVAQILEGIGSGQFSHQAEPAGVLEYTSGTKTWKVTRSRIFNNNSGASITVKEVGLYGVAWDPCMHERSVLDPTVAVANGAQLTVTYEISMDFSAID
jgi:hypothetical protein